MMRIPAISFAALLAIGLLTNFAFDSFIQLMMIYALINMIFGMSLNLVNGYTGQFSLGHAGFMAVGAYLSAYASTLIPPWHSGLQIPYFLLLTLIGGAGAAVAGWLVGLPSLRLRGDYLAIVTLGFGEIIRVVLLNTQAVGGARGFYGIIGPQSWDLLGFEISGFLTSFVIASMWLVACFFIIWRLINSGHGRAFLSVREDEIAAEAMGVDTIKTKVRAFALSSFLAGVAGSLFAHYTNYLNPATFSFQKSVDAVIIVVLGGMGSLSGSILAALFVTLLPEFLRPLQTYIGIDLRMVIYSCCLILLMILRPQGLMGHKEIFSRWVKSKI